MPTTDVQPKSLDGIKRLAKSISRRDGIKHAEALSMAASQTGYSNYQHALRTLSASDKVAPTPRHITYIVVPWHDRKSEQHGQEAIKVSLKKPLDEIIKPTQYRDARALWRFNRAASDKIVCEGRIESADQAVLLACAAARVLQFMAATALHPSATSSPGPHRYVDTSIPGNDHLSNWYDPTSQRYVTLDEPYAESVVSLSAKRAAWARRHGWDLLKSEWPGLYFPEGGCELYIMAQREKGFPAHILEVALKDIGSPIMPDNCDRVEISYRESFRSPSEFDPAVNS